MIFIWFDWLTQWNTQLICNTLHTSVVCVLLNKQSLWARSFAGAFCYDGIITLEFEFLLNGWRWARKFCRVSITASFLVSILKAEENECHVKNSNHGAYEFLVLLGIIRSRATHLQRINHFYSFDAYSLENIPTLVQPSKAQILALARWVKN